MEKQTTHTIRTTVLIPHYNNLDGLYKSLESIAPEPRVRVLIVDDGSKTGQRPDEAELQRRFGQNMEVFVLLNEQNRGITSALNQGLEHILNYIPDCLYIARLDCGDTCHPERFAIQERYMDEHPDIMLLGSWVDFLTPEGELVYTYRTPTSHKEITKKMYQKVSFIHPSVMMRRKAIVDLGLYPEEFRVAQDYAYFFKFVKKYQTAVIPQSLTFCEWSPKGISMSRRKEQLKMRLKILWSNKKFSEPYFWLGIIRTTLLFVLPYDFILWMKKKLDIQ